MMHRYTIYSRVIILRIIKLSYYTRSPTGVRSGSIPLPFPLLLPPCEVDLEGEADEEATRGRGIRECADFLEDEGDTAGEGEGEGEGVRGACGGG